MRAAEGFGSGQVSVGRIASEKREDFGWVFHILFQTLVSIVLDG